MKGITLFLLLVSFSALYSQPVTLRDTTNQYDYIIITVPEFVNACVPFKQHKETVRDFGTLIVDTTQIYAEFDSSATPQDNIRDFISYAGTFWQEPRPKYFLIVGTITDVPNFPIPFPSQPTASFPSDYYYINNRYSNDTTSVEFYVGRIPAKNTDEIENYFTKVIDYESNDTLYGWMNNALFICEDDIQFGFLDAAFEISEYFPSYIKSDFLFQTDTSLFYGNLDSIYNRIENKGFSTVWFEGHVTDSGFAYPNWFSIEDLNNLTNTSKYFVSIFVSAQYSIRDTNKNFTSELMFLSNGGSIGGIVFIAPAYWSTGKMFQYHWAERLYSLSIPSLGQDILDSLPISYSLLWYMKLITNLWADPSLKLKYDTTVDVEKVKEAIPQNFSLYQNYPNPFNPTTTIKFNLPSQSNVKLNIYNALGQLVETLVDKEMSSGYHEIEFNASDLASGIYLYQLQAGNFNSVKKMLLIK